MRIAVDMDEVLADTHAAKLSLFRQMGYDWSDEEMTGRRLSDLAAPEHAAAMTAELHKGLVFGHLDVIAGAQDALRALGADHEIIIATAAMEFPASCSHKLAWMRQHFPFIPQLNIVLCGHKHVISADMLIDDSPRHFDRFQGIGVCFSAPHNAGQDVAHRLDRWADAPDLIARLA